MKKILSEAFYKKADSLILDYPIKQYALIPLLHMAQKEHGAIDDNITKELSEYLTLPITHILGVVTFYTMFRRENSPKNYIGVCTNISCWLKGGEELYEEVKTHLKLNGLEKDYYLEKTECLGACGYAPVIQFNEIYLENADFNMLNSKLKNIKQPA